MTTIPSPEAERAAYEQWMKSEPGYPFAGAYSNLMWKAWQAARRAPLAGAEPVPLWCDKCGVDRGKDFCPPEHRQACGFIGTAAVNRATHPAPASPEPAKGCRWAGDTCECTRAQAQRCEIIDSRMPGRTPTSRSEQALQSLADQAQELGLDYGPAVPSGAVLVPRATLQMIEDAMNHMGDQLNEMDVVDEADEAIATPAFEALTALLATPFSGGEAEKAFVDAINFGTGMTLGGKHVPYADLWNIEDGDGADRAEEARAAARYEFVRKLHPHEFANLWRENIAGKGAFDDLIDAAMAALPPTKEVK